MYLFNMISTYSLVPLVIVSLFRLPEMNRYFRPFLYLVFISLVTETYISVLPHQHKSNYVSNLFVLVQYYLICWFLYDWKLLAGSNWLKYLIVASPFCVWMLDNFILHSPATFNTIYRLFACILLVFLLTWSMFLLRIPRLENIRQPAFVILMGFLLFFVFKSIVEIVYWVEPDVPDYFYQYVFLAFLAINILCNLLFILAVIWTPRKIRLS
jgi:hypothetical protein